MAAHDHDAWVALAAAAKARVVERQQQMIARYDLMTGSIQYYWDIDEAAITWSRDGGAFLRGRITYIGSVYAPNHTWLWSWANDSVPAAARGDIEAVRRFGEEHHHPLLAAPSFRADQEWVDQATMVALDLVGAEGLWRSSNDDLHLLFGLHDLTPCQS